MWNQHTTQLIAQRINVCVVAVKRLFSKSYPNVIPALFSIIDERAEAKIARQIERRGLKSFHAQGLLEKLGQVGRDRSFIDHQCRSGFARRLLQFRLLFAGKCDDREMFGVRGLS